MRGDRRRRAVRLPPPSTVERIGIAAVALVAASLSAAAGVHPTALAVPDAAYAACLAAGIVVAASGSRSWALLATTSGAALVAPDHLLAVGVAAEVASLVLLVLRPRRRRVVGAMIGGAVSQIVLGLGAGPFVGSTALMAAAIAGPVVASSLAASRRSTRRRFRTAALTAGGVAAGLFALAAVATIEGRIHAQLALDHVRAGLDAAATGDTQTAADELERASIAFRRSTAIFSSWWSQPARMLPVVGLQLGALREASAAGADLAAAGENATREADVEQLRIRSGRLDLSQLEAMEQPLLHLRRALASTAAAIREIETPWLVPPIATRIDSLRLEVMEAREGTELALQATSGVPSVLGEDGPVTYLALFASPAEARDLGGFAGAYAELVAESGQLRLERTGPISELNGFGPSRTLSDPSSLPPRYLAQEPHRFWQNITGTPDLPTAAGVARELWSQSDGRSTLGGVIYVDAYAIDRLLGLTGPVSIPGYDLTLRRREAALFFLRDLYEAFPEDAERDQFVADAIGAVFDALTSTDLPAPRAVGEALGPAVGGGHLALHSFDPVGQALIDGFGIGGRLPDVDGGDFLSLRTANAGANKIDTYLERLVEYDVVYDEATGFVEATARIELRNTAPPGGLPDVVLGNTRGLPPGTNRLELAWYTPLGLTGATVDGEPVPTSTNAEYGRVAHGVSVAIPPGGNVLVELRLEGVIAAGGYHLTATPQPAANPTAFHVQVQSAEEDPLEAAAPVPRQLTRTTRLLFTR